MKVIHKLFIFIILFISALWLATEHAQSTMLEFWSIRKFIIYGSGIIATTAMSIGMLLVIRHIFPDAFLDGLDKRYRLHKWLGITALLFAFIHWLLKNASKWLVDLDLLVKPAKKAVDEVSLNGFEVFLLAQRSIAKDIGEWAFYAFVILCLLMLVKKVSYHTARQSHKLMSVIYLLIAYHSFILMKPDDWLTPLGLVIAILLIIGTLSAFIAMFGKIGFSKTAYGKISQLIHYEEGKTLAVTITPTTPWKGHKAGQFAFVTFDAKEGAHPFSFASDWSNKELITFGIKQIGDYVKTLPDVLKLDDQVKIEGPYGNFDFNSTKKNHVWIAGGIGIVPFYSKLESLATQKNEQQGNEVTLFYTTNNLDESFTEDLKLSCEKVGVTLHIIDTKKQGHLTGEDVNTCVTKVTDTDVWICGPAKLGDNIKSYFLDKGLSHRHIHQELFEMR